jgi:hypothetical protein
LAAQTLGNFEAWGRTKMQGNEERRKKGWLAERQERLCEHGSWAWRAGKQVRECQGHWSWSWSCLRRQCSVPQMGAELALALWNQTLEEAVEVTFPRQAGSERTKSHIGGIVGSGLPARRCTLDRQGRTDRAGLGSDISRCYTLHGVRYAICAMRRVDVRGEGGRTAYLFGGGSNSVSW